MLVKLTAALMALLGLSLAAGGAWLAGLGGGWAYLLMGLGLAACGVMLWQRQASALGAYAVLLVGTGAWALWEVGLDRWQLVPRGAFLSLLALWLLTPWVSRALTPPARGAASSAWPLPRRGLVLATLLAVGVAMASLLDDPAVLEGRLPRSDATASTAAPTHAPTDDWTAYGGTGQGQRYSALTDISPDTIGRLRHAWTFRTGDMKHEGDPTETTYQVTPLKVGDTLYVCTPRSIVIALDAATGTERWRHDPKVAIGPSSQHMTCRGLGYHDEAAGAPAGAPASPSPSAPCARRLLLPAIDGRLIALDASTGAPCAGFGNGGVVDLKDRMPHLAPGSYMVTSPPVVTRDLVITGSSINDNVRVNNPSGVIRAFDVRTGQLVWNWHAARPDATAPLPPGALYPEGGPNSWSVASVDEALGLVYLPLANTSPDLLSASRTADVQRFVSAVVALDLASGQVRWVFQTVHNDLWDRDVPAQPTLVDLTIGGERVPVLVAPTKQGDIYVLDRRTGQPVLPVQEHPVPTDGAPSETVSPTQPSSALSLMPPLLKASDMWGATPWDQLVCRIRFHSLRYDGPYTPPTTKASLVYPGNTGVFNWGGVAVDPVREILVASPVRLAFTHRLVPRTDPEAPLVTDGVEPFNENYGGRFAFDMGPFTSPLGVPCQAPPWGLLAGVDLRTGQVAWQRRNGTVRDSLPAFMPLPLEMGVPSLGGPLLTAGGVAFYSGTLDQYLRAYDVTTGRRLWQARLPFGGQATPMTYRANGRQMVVVAAGGHGSLGTRTGDAVVAFVLEP